MTQHISVRAPKFDLYEIVSLHWNDRTGQGRIVKRWLDFNDELWFYQLDGIGSSRLCPEDALEFIVQPQSGKR
jgi:hypothetical protein